MRFFSSLLPVLAAATLAAPGCGTRPGTVDDAALAERRRQLVSKVNVTRTALQSKGSSGALRGRLEFTGELPPPVVIKDVSVHPDKDLCLDGASALYRESWVIDRESRGVANAIVYVSPPTGTYFNLSPQQTNRKGQVVVLDQPRCSFVPHAVGLFPAYFDGTKHVPTGQVLEIRNGDKVPHSVQWDQTRENDAAMFTLPRGGKKEYVLNPQRQPLLVGCGNHRWMFGVVWPFEHPYFALTATDGSFEIKDLPTGVELTVTAWHEWKRAPFETRTLSLEDGDNPPLALKISK
jgi:hypothetical protein